MEILIRDARMEDAADIARLSGELAYPASTEQIEDRLRLLLAQQNQFIAVAAHGNGGLLGWVAGELRLNLESGKKAELTGLVVGADARRSGVGRRLVSAVENWAVSLGYDTIVVRSNVGRIESHPFYAGLGYARTKTQHVYVKQRP
jgi:GNAT superfamily N-acetyltransferase